MAKMARKSNSLAQANHDYGIKPLLCQHHARSIPTTARNLAPVLVAIHGDDADLLILIHQSVPIILPERGRGVPGR